MDYLLCNSFWHQREGAKVDYNLKVGICCFNGSCCLIINIICPKRTEDKPYENNFHIAFKRMEEHLESLKKAIMAKSPKYMEDSDPKLHHHGEDLPNYYNRVMFRNHYLIYSDF